MSFTTAIIAPLVLMISGATPVPPTGEFCAASPASGIAEAVMATAESPRESGARGLPDRFVSQSYRPQSVFQARIEQTIRIRIVPLPRPSSAPVRPNMFVELPPRAISPDFVERKIGKCLPVEAIAGVQPQGSGNLILHLSDRRMVKARLERACRARDFYSGFYLSPSRDGRLCVNRDLLQSRSGANCRLSELRQLVEADH